MVGGHLLKPRFLTKWPIITTSLPFGTTVLS